MIQLVTPAQRVGTCEFRIYPGEIALPGLISFGTMEKESKVKFTKQANDLLHRLILLTRTESHADNALNPVATRKARTLVLRQQLVSLLSKTKPGS